jgi:hypothetical protein
VKDVAVRDLTIAHADVTYLADYETPSGGGYSIHRGGAVEIEGAENPGKKENTPFLRYCFYTTTIILPRQARDKHTRERALKTRGRMRCLVVVSNVVFDSPGGNGLLLSGYVRCTLLRIA